jgi:hypothetical protein
MRVAWNIGDWGPACGPRPSGGGAPAGSVSVQQSGGELSFSGAGRSYSTTECWEQFPGLRRVSHSGGQRGWRSVCKTAANDSRQATIVTTLSATDSTITFDETGQYQFVLQGQNCTASVRRSRSYQLVQREGAPPPQPAVSAAAPEATAPGRACAAPGAPLRLEVRPSRKLMRPGEDYTFRAVVLDAQGCVLDRTPLWRVVTKDAAAKLVAPGKIHIDDDAPEGNIDLSATVAGHAANVVVEVASRSRYDALLESGGFNASGESSDAAVAIIASGSIGARAAVARAQARSHKRVFVAVLGAAALVLGLVGLMMTRRARLRRGAGQAEDSPEPEGAAAGVAAKRSARVCPTCREEYPPDAQFCAVDGNRLVSLADANREPRAAGGICPVCGQGFDPGVLSCPRHDEELVPAAVYLASRAAEAKPGKRICPVCGTQYPGDSQFCGNDGASLVPVN